LIPLLRILKRGKRVLITVPDGDLMNALLILHSYRCSEYAVSPGCIAGEGQLQSISEMEGREKFTVSATAPVDEVTLATLIDEVRAAFSDAVVKLID
jgi:hypothetical protein